MRKLNISIFWYILQDLGIISILFFQKNDTFFPQKSRHFSFCQKSVTIKIMEWRIFLMIKPRRSKLGRFLADVDCDETILTY